MGLRHDRFVLCGCCFDVHLLFLVKMGLEFLPVLGFLYICYYRSNASGLLFGALQELFNQLYNNNAIKQHAIICFIHHTTPRRMLSVALLTITKRKIRFCIQVKISLNFPILFCICNEYRNGVFRRKSTYD